MAYINFVVLVHFILIITSLIYALYASGFLLFKKPQKKGQVSRTPVVFLYFCYTASASIATLIYAAYIVIWWRPDSTVYSPNLLYFIAGLPTIYVNLVPVADFYLCLDRCFAIAFPFRPFLYQKLKYILGVAFFLTDFAILSIYFLLTKYFSFSTPETTTTCVYYICLIWRLNYPTVMSFTKYVFCGLNFGVSVVLLGLNTFRKSDASSKLNKPVIYVSMINIFFAFAPGLSVDLLTKIIGNGFQFTEYLGDTNLTCISISIALSVQLYFRAFKKHFMKPPITTTRVQVLTTVTTTRPAARR